MDIAPLYAMLLSPFIQ